ncbi:MAG: hypothetical protein H6745_33610 [Deltaproteobacteria bacterium]|nr:hypothetical protein [Deltaproteobacteria bacterium]
MSTSQLPRLSARAHRAAALALAASVGALLAAVTGGCGTSCEEIRADRDRFLARHDATDAPHAELVLPLELANDLAARRFQRLRSPRLAVAALANAGARVAFEIRGARLVPAAEPGLVGVVIDVTVVDDAPADPAAGPPLRDIVSFSLEARVRPAFDLASRRAVVWLRPADLVGVAPQLEERGRAEVRAWLRDVLPDAIAAAAPDELLNALSDVALAWFAEDGWPLIRDNLLDDLDAVPLLDLVVPGDLPLARADFTTVAGRHPALVVDLVTTLPVRRGLPPRAGVVRPGVIDLRIAGDAAAEIANEAIARGALPGRYTSDGEPAADGPFEARVGWEPGRRPLKVHLWRTRDECVYARVGGTPEPRLEADDAALRVRDGEYEVVRGPGLTEAFAWTKRLWGDSVALNLAVARRTRVDVGGALLELTATALEIGPDALRVELRAALPNLSSAR